MAKRSKKNRKQQTETTSMVIVVFAEDLSEAQDYEETLKNNNIPVVVKDQTDDVYGDSRIAVMVPEDHLDEAQAVINSENAFNEFYDNEFDDELSEDFDNGIFDDEY